MSTLTFNFVNQVNPPEFPWNGQRFTPIYHAQNTTVLRRFVGWPDPNKEGYTPSINDLWKRATVSEPPRIILDTDFWTDVGDAQVVMTALTYHSEGKANLLGIGVSDSGDIAPACVSKMLVYYGITDVPVASLYVDDPTFEIGDAGAELVALYSNPIYPGGLGLAINYPGIVASYKSWLNSSPDNSVTIVTAGHMRGLNLLLQDSEGLSLFNSKVLQVMCMGGMYLPLDAVVGEPDGTFGGVGPDDATFTNPHNEFNITSDGFNWREVLTRNTTKPMIFAGFELGQVQQIGEPYNSSRRPAGDILRYLLANAPFGSSRPSWDIWPLYWAVEGESNPYGITTIRGTNVVDVFGNNRFTPSQSGQHYFLQVDLSTSAKRALFQSHFNSLQAADCVQGTKVWNGSSWANI